MSTLGKGRRFARRPWATSSPTAGGTVWLCGPMNVVPSDPVRGTWLPDPWNPDESSVPPRPGSDRLVHPVATCRSTPTPRSRLSPPITSGSSGGGPPRPLGWRRSEAVVAAGRGADRATQTGGGEPRSLDRFQWDLFEHVYRRDRPRLRDLLLEHHRALPALFWRYMDPDAFDVDADAAEEQIYGPAIHFGLRRDGPARQRRARPDRERPLARALHRAQPAALPRREAEGGSRFHRPCDLGDFVRRLGVAG